MSEDPRFRSCTVCNLKGISGVRAVHAAQSANGMMWYECEGHTPTDHGEACGRQPFEPKEPRVSLEPIGQFLNRAWHGKADITDVLSKCDQARAALKEVTGGE